jgi:hypothetical protein
MSWHPSVAALLIVVLAGLLPLPAAAQAPGSSSAPSAAEVRRELQSLPPARLRAMRHQQTREGDARRLEDQHFGGPQAERFRSQQQTEVDQLYQQVIRGSQVLGSPPR